MKATAMQRSVVAGMCVVICSARPTVAQPASPAERPSISATVASSALRLDGILNDAAWRAADSITSLRQIEPREGSDGSAPTVIKVLTDGDALIFGIRAEYRAGVPVVAFARERDAALTSEDHVKI